MDVPLDFALWIRFLHLFGSEFPFSSVSFKASASGTLRAATVASCQPTGWYQPRSLVSGSCILLILHQVILVTNLCFLSLEFPISDALPAATTDSQSVYFNKCLF